MTTMCELFLWSSLVLLPYLKKTCLYYIQMFNVTSMLLKKELTVKIFLHQLQTKIIKRTNIEYSFIAIFFYYLSYCIKTSLRFKQTFNGCYSFFFFFATSLSQIFLHYLRCCSFEQQRQSSMECKASISSPVLNLVQPVSNEISL